MTKFIPFIIALVFTIDVSAQARASVTASVTIVDMAGNSFTNTEANTGGVTLSMDSIMLRTSANNGIRLVNNEQTVKLGKLNMGGSVVYSVMLPAEPIVLSRLSGTERLTIQLSQLATTDTNSNSSLHIIAACKPGKAQAPGYYVSNAPVDIVVNYN